jgi:hypothetical protein
LSLGWIASELMHDKLRAWAPAAVALGSLLATYILIPPNCGVPKYNLSQELLRPEPLDPARLYLSVYPAAESTYRAENKPEPIGQIVRPGSTSMFAGLHFINGYSPILASGVAKEFGFAIHGEFDWEKQKELLETGEGEQLLDYLGVDGIVVATESGLTPISANKWTAVLTTDEGTVYHRKELSPPAFLLTPAVSVQFGSGTAHEQRFTLIQGLIEKIAESRNSIAVSVPGATVPGELIVFSRPYFRGYRATLNGQELPVTAWRGLMPAIELPKDAEGPLVLNYRPWWLVWGGAAALACLLIILALAVLLFVRPGTRGS